ncbi:MAG: mechanosensitive ion channel family protein [Ilumatobacter sp.]|uniref:mechanosensitive ion channel family protein n=1 Tax=Ilumatobacter sp. TaxID=1967498 RepID=UPI00391A5A3B
MPSNVWSGLSARLPTPDPEQTRQATEGFRADRWLPAVVIVVAAVVIGLVVKELSERTLRSRNEIVARLIARTSLAITVSIGLFHALSQLGIRVGLLLGGLGVGGFALAFALKDTLSNLISGAILQLRQPFDYSDAVRLGDFTGRVDDINLRSVEMTTLTGEKVIIPSSEVLQNPIVNYSANASKRIDIAIGFSYDADLVTVSHLLSETAQHVDGVLADPPAVTIFDAFGGSTIDVTLTAWATSDANIFDIQLRLAGALKAALDEAGIDMPYPTRALVDPARAAAEAARTPRNRAASTFVRRPTG